MDIRPINDSELHQLIELHCHLHANDDPVPSDDILDTTWRTIQASNNIHYFGLFIDHVLVSACTIAIIPNLTRGCRSYGLIENVVTHKDYRRNYYGQHLLKYTLAYAKAQNCYKVMLMTGNLTAQAFRFYESLGFNRHEKQAFIQHF